MCLHPIYWTFAVKGLKHLLCNIKLSICLITKIGGCMGSGYFPNSVRIISMDSSMGMLRLGLGLLLQLIVSQEIGCHSFGNQRPGRTMPRILSGSRGFSSINCRDPSGISYLRTSILCWLTPGTVAKQTVLVM